MTSSRPRVFISYSHRDEVWKDKLLPHLKALEQAGVGMVVWQDRQIDPGEHWYPAIEQAMADAAAAVLLISADYLASDFCIKEEVPYLLAQQEQRSMLLIPVLIRRCAWKAHRWLASRQMLPRDGRCVALDFPGDQADVIFSEVAERVLDQFAKLATEPEAAQAIPKAVQLLAAGERARREGEAETAPQWPALPPDRIDLTRLPETGAALFGRDQELQLLDSAWSSAVETGSAPTRIVAFTANGGVGKSTLVNHWLRDMHRDHFRGATRVFGWSFYSQGAREEGMASADTFIDAALRFFGDADPTAGSPWDKGERLARLVGAQRALLVLDGIEPLQSRHAFERGTLRDPALHTLLCELARHSEGLCLITTREPLPDLHGVTGVTFKDLELISPEAGRALLRTARVVGTDAELEELSKRFGLHALTVSLLGVYLHENDPAHGTGPAQALEQLPGAAPIDRVLAGFEALLAGSAELEVLRLLGLFDRPADSGCLGALRVRPVIAGLTERVVRLRDAGWNGVLARLERLRLIHVQRKGSGKAAVRNRPYAVDAHPLLREHFAAELRVGQAKAWRAAHRRLYEHLRDTTEHRPGGLDGLQPLYQAVAHGCQAGLHQEACDNVYYDRILRGEEFYSTSKLGAVGADLGAVACFFEQPWTRPSSNLSEPYQVWVLNEAATRLRALGRVTEALEPMRANLKMRVDRQEWQHAPSSGSNLSDVELTLGDVTGAVRDAEQSVIFADRGGNAFWRMVNRAAHAHALLEAGERTEALARLREAERMQAEHEPECPLLYSLQGFLYCDLLLAEAERAAWTLFLRLRPDTQNLKPELDACHSVSQRAAKTLKWELGKPGAPLLDFALHHLTLGRAALYRVILDDSAFRTSASAFQLAYRELAAAVDGLRAACMLDHVPRGLLTRGWLRVLEGDLAGAHADLDQAWQIAERGSMKLFMADIHLHRARLFRDKSEIATARALIESCGYWRRKEELEDAEKAAGSW